MIQGKIWGETQTLLVTPMIEVHRIMIDPGGYCSMHKHEFKWNMFYMIYGELDIHVRKNDYDLVDVTNLNVGEFTSVAPNEYHMFKAREGPASALEIYYLESISKDIIRETVGGLT
jgi:quercetin dioxygenase-like cupin family protein